MSDEKALNFFYSIGQGPNQFNHFDYVDYIQSLDEEQLRDNPRKRKIISEFLQKCEVKMKQTQRSKNKSWKNFIRRSEEFRKYTQQKNQALRFINQHYDHKCQQILFHPKINKSNAIQSGIFWKDKDTFDQIIPQQEPILKPNQSEFHSTCCQ